MLLMRSTSPINYLSGKRLRMPGSTAGLASIREEAIAMKPPPLYAAWAARARHRYVPSRELCPKSGRAQPEQATKPSNACKFHCHRPWGHALCVNSSCLSRPRVGHGFDCSPVLGFCSRTNQSCGAQELCKAHDRSAVKTRGSAAISRHTRGRRVILIDKSCIHRTARRKNGRKSQVPGCNYSAGMRSQGVAAR